tara:strand:- start:157617 stop:158402 length:786 start_codon:yes stop_codon:yes gene_type:complete
MSSEMNRDTASESGRPETLAEAIELFQPVMINRRVPLKSRKFFVRWIERFDAFRTSTVRRSFRTLNDNDVAAFLIDQHRRFSPPEWQRKQAQQAVVLFLRNVIGVTEIDTRRITDLLRGGAGSTVDDGQTMKEVAVLVDQSRPEWYQQVQRALRTQHYALATEQAYLDWLERYVVPHGESDPRELGTTEVRAFLEHLAVERNVAASTQNQAFSALLFVCLNVFEVELSDLSGTSRARGDKRLPVTRWCDDTIWANRPFKKQ